MQMCLDQSSVQTLRFLSLWVFVKPRCNHVTYGVGRGGGRGGSCCACMAKQNDDWSGDVKVVECAPRSRWALHIKVIAVACREAAGE